MISVSSLSFRRLINITVTTRVLSKSFGFYQTRNWIVNLTLLLWDHSQNLDIYRVASIPKAQLWPERVQHPITLSLLRPWMDKKFLSLHQNKKSLYHRSSHKIVPNIWSIKVSWFGKLKNKSFTFLTHNYSPQIIFNCFHPYLIWSSSSFIFFL